MTKEFIYSEIERLDVPYLRIGAWVNHAQRSGNIERMQKALEYLQKLHENYEQRKWSRVGAPTLRDYDVTGRGDYLKIVTN